MQFNHASCSNSWRCPKMNFTWKVKNTRTEIIWYSSYISTFNDLSKWHNSHTKYWEIILFINTIVYFFILQKRRLIFVKSAIYVFLVNSIVMSAQLHINKEWWEWNLKAKAIIPTHSSSTVANFFSHHLISTNK